MKNRVINSIIEKYDGDYTVLSSTRVVVSFKDDTDMNQATIELKEYNYDFSIDYATRVVKISV